MTTPHEYQGADTTVVMYLGAGSAACALLLWAPSLALGCAVRALGVSAVSLLAGGTLGGLLATITRTRRPVWIYVCLLGALATFWPLFSAWPPASEENIHPWQGAPQIVYGYFDLLRYTMFLVGLPFPFAQWGYHAADPLPEAGEKEAPGTSEENRRNRNTL